MSNRKGNSGILPDPHVNVMITYTGKVRVRDKYYDKYETRTVTRRAFYTDSDGYYNSKDEWVATPEGYYHVPQYWREHTWSDGTVSLMPDTFYHHGRVMPHEVTKWVYDN